MILFKKRFIDPILSGAKTQTRRVGKRRWNVGSIHQARTSYVSEAFAHLRILDVRQERVGDITETDARAEGVGSVEEFVRLWPTINGEWDPDLAVWVVTFEREEVTLND